MIVSSRLDNVQSNKLVNILKMHRKAIGDKIDDIKGLNPTIPMYRILLEDETMEEIQKLEKSWHTQPHENKFFDPLLTSISIKPEETKVPIIESRPLPTVLNIIAPKSS